MREHFLKIAESFLSTVHIGPRALAELLEQVYESGVIDERYGDWGKNPVQQKSKIELQEMYDNPEIEVQDEAGNSSSQGSAYKAAINEFTPLSLRR